MSVFTNQTIKNEEITLLNNVVNRLAHQLVMEDCIINFKLTSRALICAQAKFLNCTLNFKTRLNNHPFSSVYFENCTFKGKLSSSEFGRRKWIHEPEKEKIIAGIKNCDFSEVTVFDGIRFIDCDIDTIIFPKFPHFVVKYPFKNAQKILDSNLPKLFKSLFEPNKWLMETDNALLFNFNESAKYYDISVEEFKNLISQYDFIEM